jgi:NAD(P)-dependent dehydrogenase (short-subunit alcohol dehydrogenase family)
MSGNSVVLITGALTGIGRATALAFAKEGACIMISGRREEAGQVLLSELRAIGAEADFQRTDVRREEDVTQLFDATVARFGRIDVAVNNAGMEGDTGPIIGLTVENYRAVFDTNVLGVMLSLKHEMRVMVKQGNGSIINLSSVSGQIGLPGASVYVASKHAVEGLTKCAALEVAAAGVQVNSVAPGPVATDMLERFTGHSNEAKADLLMSVPAQRAATPDEIAATIIFLASGNARYLTGQNIAIDGGYTAQ